MVALAVDVLFSIFTLHTFRQSRFSCTPLFVMCVATGELALVNWPL